MTTASTDLTTCEGDLTTRGASPAFCLDEPDDASIHDKDDVDTHELASPQHGP